MAVTAKPEVVQPDDATLVARLQRGDGSALRMLYQRHARYVAGVAYRLLGNDDELDDVVQETFLAAVDGIGRLQDPTRLRGWLVVIATRRARRFMKTRFRRVRLAQELRRESARPAAVAGGRRLDEVYEALERLPVKLRVPWMLSRVEGLTHAEVGEACGRSVATVKRRIGAADEKLKRMLDVA